MRLLPLIVPTLIVAACGPAAEPARGRADADTARSAACATSLAAPPGSQNDTISPASGTCADFENDIGSMSVKTPKGRFECINNQATDHLQVLRLDGRVIYQEVRGPSGVMEDSTLRHGIVQRGVGCPWVVAVHRGLVVIVREMQPPAYGVQGYAVIDFNKAEPSLTPLASGQRPEDDNIPSERRIEWSEDSFVLRVLGYAPDEECCTVGAPEPRALRVRYTYENRRVEVVKD